MPGTLVIDVWPDAGPSHEATLKTRRPVAELTVVEAVVFVLTLFSDAKVGACCAAPVKVIARAMIEALAEALTTMLPGPEPGFSR